LGSYPHLSLANARKEARLFKELLNKNIDPKEHRLENEKQQKEAHTLTFEFTSKKWLKLKESKVSEVYYKKISNRLETYVFPKLGKLPLHKINAVTTIETITPVADQGKLETVKKLCRWINEIMLFAVNTGLIHSNPLSGIGKAFDAPKVVNLPTIKPGELPELMQRINNASIKIVTRCLIEWQLHTMVRPNEAAGTRWDEIDLDKALWTIPPERMKKNRPHIVPLSPQALALLQVIKPISGSREYVFPANNNPKRSANSQTVNMALKRMGFKGRLVAHGLRALASTTLNEQGFDPDVIEAALAHIDKNSIRAAYNRADYLERRKTMLCWWSEHIEQAATGNFSLSGSMKHLKVI
jgi:integrase